MPTPEHEAYRNAVQAYFHQHADDADTCTWLHDHAAEVATLWELDLGPAREVLQRCFSDEPRGGDPWDAVVKLRSLHASQLFGCPAINEWVRRLRSDERLRVVIGVQPPPPGSRRAAAPSVDAHYTLMHRLHDGPLRKLEGVVPPSVLQRERAGTPRPRQLPPTPELAEGSDDLPTAAKTAKLVDRLLAGRDRPPADDLTQRLLQIHLQVAVQPSAERGLLGDPLDLVVGSDGSPLPTYACGTGRRVCGCPARSRCDCPRVYADPDASWGYDHYRESYFFGHHLYALSVSQQGVDLPLMMQLSGGNETDQTAGVRAWDRWTKTQQAHDPEWRSAVAVEDAGHDSVDNHRFFGALGIRPVIPLAKSAPRTTEARPDLVLSERGVPMCAAGIEMTARGTSRPGCPIFMCPVKAGKQDRCPLSPAGDGPGYLCEPDTKYGPTVVTNVAHEPRLFPAIARNSPSYQAYYALRSGCERVFAAVKETFSLRICRHMRASFWLIRSYGAAMLQHARAWVRALDLDGFVRQLLGSSPPMTSTA